MFLSVQASAQLASKDILKEADELRLSDRTVAKQLLDSIEVDTLTGDDKVYFQYLIAVIGTFDGDIKQTAEVLKNLLNVVKDKRLKVRISASYLNLLGSLGNWKEGLALGEELTNYVSDIDEQEVKYRAYLGLIAFYEQLQQPETVLNLTNRIVGKESVPAEVECGALAAHISSLIKLNSQSFSIEYLQNASQFCLDHGLTIYFAVLEMHKIAWMISQKMYSEALPYLEALIANPEVNKFTPHLTMVMSRYAEVNLKLGKIDVARDFARRILAIDSEQNYRQAIIKALEVLHVIERDYGETKEAYKYLVQLTSLQFAENVSQQEKQLAIQKAWFELDAIQHENELLDKENSLLQTKAKLVRENFENSILALVLVSLILLLLVFWSYRNHKVQAKLKHLARIDSLTKISNRRYFTEYAETLINKARVNNELVCFVILDLDHFKNINDSYGHQLGDTALVTTADTLTKTLADDAVLGRLGGEEFGAIFCGKRIDEVLNLIESCRNEIARVKLPIAEYKLKLTASFGVSSSEDVGYPFENLYAAADLALFQSKRYGRNQVYQYSPSMDS